MSTPAVENPAERLALLERQAAELTSRLRSSSAQISFLQIGFLLMAAIFFGGGYYLAITGRLRIEGLSPEVADRVNAKDIGFYNQKDTRVIFFDDDKFFMPQIIFLDDKKRLRMRLKVAPDREGSGLAVYDETGWRGFLRMEGDEASTLKLVGKKQKGGIEMSVATDGTPSLTMTDKDGKVLWQAPTKSH